MGRKKRPAAAALAAAAAADAGGSDREEDSDGEPAPPSSGIKISGWADGVYGERDVQFDRWAIQGASVVVFEAAGFTLRLEQRPSEMSPARMGFGAVCWEAAFAMAKWVEAKPHAFWAGKKIVELGAGCGLLGLLLAHLGADVILTDLEEVMPLLERNVAANQPALGPGSAAAAPLRWGAEAGAALRAALGPKPPDYIVGSDLFYNTAAVAPFVAAVRPLSGPSTEILVCFEVRAAEVLAEFDAVTAAGLASVQPLRLGPPEVPAEYAREHLRLFRLRA